MGLLVDDLGGAGDLGGHDGAQAERSCAAPDRVTVELVDGEEDEPEVVEPDRCPKCEVGTMHAIHSTPRGRPPPLAPPWTGPPGQEAA